MASPFGCGYDHLGSFHVLLSLPIVNHSRRRRDSPTAFCSQLLPTLGGISQYVALFWQWQHSSLPLQSQNQHIGNNTIPESMQRAIDQVGIHKAHIQNLRAPRFANRRDIGRSTFGCFIKGALKSE